MAELADATDLKSVSLLGSVGSSPTTTSIALSAWMYDTLCR